MPTLIRRWLMVAATVVALLTGGLVYAQSVSQSPAIVGGSGDVSSSATYTLQATIGQSVLPAGSTDTVALTAGFSSQLSQTNTNLARPSVIYLPLTAR